VIIKVCRYGGCVPSRPANAEIWRSVSMVRSMRCKGGAAQAMISGSSGCGEKAASEEGACCWLGPPPLLASRNGEGADADREDGSWDAHLPVITKTTRRRRQNRAAKGWVEGEGDW
jgi:hypothetical protein